MIALAESIIQPDIGVRTFIKLYSYTGASRRMPGRKESARAT